MQDYDRRHFQFTRQSGIPRGELGGYRVRGLLTNFQRGILAVTICILLFLLVVTP